MAKSSLDIYRRIELALNQPSKSLINVLGWLEESELLKLGSLDEIKRILTRIQQFELTEPEEFTGLLRVYLRIFERFSTDLNLRAQYFTIWNSLLDEFTSHFTEHAIECAWYMITHQVKYLKLYADGFEQIQIAADGIFYRISSMHHATYRRIPSEPTIELNDLKEFYQSRLSDEEALDLVSQHILDNS